MPKAVAIEEKITAAALMPDGMITDFITGHPVKETEKERVRQEVARQHIFEYQIAPEFSARKLICAYQTPSQ